MQEDSLPNMKFNDGFWLLKNGVKPYYATQVVQVKEESDGYALQVSTRPIRHRGDTLGGPLFTVKIHSPTEGVIGVKIDHFVESKAGPSIPLFPDAEPITDFHLAKPEGVYSLSTGGLSVGITENPYQLTFKSPTRFLTGIGHRQQALYDVPARWTLGVASNSSCLNWDSVSNPGPTKLPETVRYLHSELNLSPGELIYGFGEQFGPLVKNGQSVKIWNQDGGTSSEQAYKCVPFYLTNRNYGVFINHPGEVEVEVGSEKVSRVGISVARSNLEYFIIYGLYCAYFPSFSTLINTLDSGTIHADDRSTRVLLPSSNGQWSEHFASLIPSWTFGLWLSTSFLTSYSTETVSSFLAGMREHDCPVRVFHIDCFWMKQYEWCSFTFDPDNFPDPKAYLSDIKSRYGVKICLWINSYISQLSPIFEEALQGGFFIKREDGTPWQWDLWQPGLAVVDFTNPKACEWYKEKLSSLLDLGVDCFKTDFGERIPHASVVFHDGSDPMRAHNIYSIIYNALVFNLLRERFGEGEAVVFARSSFAGGQRFPVHWGGDCESSWEAMAEALRGCLSLTTSGFAFASHDIGGFEGHPPPEIYQRWVAFGIFSSHSRLHGSSSYRVPWNYGKEAAASMSKFLDMKHRLMPYLYNLALEATETGHPVQRVMFLEFPDDRTTHHLDRQYMLGPSLLVAPVLSPMEEETEYYLPAGRWTYLWSNGIRTIDGPVWVKERVALDDVPIWVREGTILCLGPEGIGRPDYDYTENLCVCLYGLSDGQEAQANIPAATGKKVAAKITAKRSGKKVTMLTTESCKVSSLTVFGDAVVTTAVSGNEASCEL